MTINGWTETEEQKALRAEKRKARQIVADCKEQMDDFLNLVAWAMDDPNGVLFAVYQEQDFNDLKATQQI